MPGFRMISVPGRTICVQKVQSLATNRLQPPERHVADRAAGAGDERGPKIRLGLGEAGTAMQQPPPALHNAGDDFRRDYQAKILGNLKPRTQHVYGTALDNFERIVRPRSLMLIKTSMIDVSSPRGARKLAGNRVPRSPPTRSIRSCGRSGPH